MKNNASSFPKYGKYQIITNYHQNPICLFLIRLKLWTKATPWKRLQRTCFKQGPVVPHSSLCGTPHHTHGPWNHWAWGEISPCQSTEFQQIWALWQSMAGLNTSCRFINAKCSQNKDKHRSLGWIFNTVWKTNWGRQLFPKELTGTSGRFWYENQSQIWAKTLTHYVGRFLFSWPQQETQNAHFKHSLSI